MKAKHIYFILALTIAVSLAAGGCGAGSGGGTSNQNLTENPTVVIPSEDPKVKLLREGDAIKGVVKNDCDQSIVLESLNTLCELFGAGSCVDQKSKCNDYSRQIYTGSTLVEESNGSKWNGRGGSGQLMADAALCTLRELSPKVSNAGPLLSDVDIDIGIGHVKVRQEVGYLNFDNAKARFEGYRKMRVEMPVLGKFDPVSQHIDLSRAEFGGHNFNPYPFAGGYQILFGYGLNLSTEEKSKSLEIKPKPIQVLTPLGAFSAQPTFNYESNTGVADEFVTDHTYWILKPDFYGDVAIKLSDLHGIMPGVANNTTPNPPVLNFKDGRTGWISQIGLGNRGTGTDDVWGPPSSGSFERPDIPIGVADFLPYESRSDKENRASVYAKASAPLKWPEDPYELLPGWVKPLADTAGIKPKAHIIVTPTIEAGAGGQFGIVMSEGTNQRRSGENDVLRERFALMGIYSGVRAGASFDVKTQLIIKVVAGFDTFFGPITKTLIDIDPEFPIPLAGDKIASGVKLASAVSTSANQNPEFHETLDVLTTFKETKPDPKAFIEQCYANVIQAEDPPKTEAEEGKAEDLFPDEIWPCNICIATDEVKDQGGTLLEPSHADLLLPAQTAPVWKCDSEAKSGCMDLCKWSKTFDEAGKPILVVVKGPTDIAADIPANDPNHDFFLSCMVSCVNSPTPVNFGSVTAYPCVGDAIPPAIASTNTTNTAGPFPTNTGIAVTFNDSMDDASINGTTFMVADSDGNTVSGRVTYDPDTRTATFTPDGGLAYSTTYTATITTGVMDDSGNKLAEDYSWNFTTIDAPDTTPPTVISRNPANSARDVAVDSSVFITFSEPIDTSTIAGSISVNNPDGPVPVTLIFTGDNAIVIFDPTANFAYSTLHSVRVTPGVQDTAGNPMTEGVLWSFTTAAQVRDSGSER